MVSDGLSMMNAEFSSRSFRVMPVRIGKRNYLGNAISCPAGGADGRQLPARDQDDDPGLAVRCARTSGCSARPASRSRARCGATAGSIGSPAEPSASAGWPPRHGTTWSRWHCTCSCPTCCWSGLVAIAMAPSAASASQRLGGTVASAFLELAVAIAWFVLLERAVTGFRAVATAVLLDLPDRVLAPRALLEGRADRVRATSSTGRRSRAVPLECARCSGRPPRLR